MKTKFTNSHLTATINNLKFKLVYKVRKYIEVDIDSTKIEEVNNFLVVAKADGRKFRFFNNEKKWYELLEDKIISLDQRKKTVEKILQSHIGIFTVEGYIEYKWLDKNFNKTTSTQLLDREAMFLDTIGTYYLVGFEEKDILSINRQNLIYKKEVFELNGEFESENIKQTPVKDTLVSKRQQKKWRSTSTYKFNKIFHKKNTIIDLEKPYFSEWCYVNAYNQFAYNGSIYEISKNLPQYQVRITNREERMTMDSIFILEQDGILNFYDMKVNKINNKEIKVI